jgi:hypothetical protein
MKRLAVLAVAAVLIAACAPREQGPILYEVAPQPPAMAG